MKTSLLTLLVIGTLGLFGATALRAQAMSDLQGKWTLKKTSDRFGGEVTQTVTFKDDSFTYNVKSKTGETLLHAKGKVKLEKLGPFKVMKLVDIEGGYSESSLEATNDDRMIIYTTGYNTLTVALNFDQSRDGEAAEADTYTKAKN